MTTGLGRGISPARALRWIENTQAHRPASGNDALLRRGRQFLVIALFSLLVATAGCGDTAQARSEAHADAFRIVDFDWVDGVRARPVPARLYWPNDSARAARVPLIVFSHGMGGSRRGYSYLARHWASRGVASLHVQHVGSDTSVWAGNPFTLVQRLQTAAHENEALARGMDIRFALDRVLSNEVGAYAARVDRKRIIAAGHSYGANTALVAVGAGVMREGRRIEAQDARFAAAILISAPPFYGERDLASVLDHVRVPTLHVTATDDVIRIPGYYSAVTDRLTIYNAISTPRKVLAVFQGGSHSMFTDRALTGGRDLNPKVKAATAELALAFLDQAFDSNQTEMARWTSRWQPILALSPVTSPLHGLTGQSRKAGDATAGTAVSR